MSVQIIPFSGKPLDFDHGSGGKIRFPSSEHGFLIGKENSLLEPILQEIIDCRIPPDRQPILFYGVIGTGRTHLLKGILETWRRNQTNDTLRRQAYYSTCADFARQFSEAVASRTTDAFRRRYNKAKLVLLDDLEQLFTKPAAQMELRLMLDSVAAEERVIVLTSQTLPKVEKTSKKESLSEDLAVRIQAGTVIPIALPGEAVRQRFVYNLASALRIPISEELSQKVGKTLTGTIPQIYVSIAQKYVEAKSADEPIDLAFWKKFSRKQQAAMSVEASTELSTIVKQTAGYFSLRLGDLKGTSRSKTTALARSLAVYLAKTKLHLTFKEIGIFLGKRDPSTARHLFEKINTSLPSSPELQDHLLRIENQCCSKRKVQ